MFNLASNFIFIIFKSNLLVFGHIHTRPTESSITDQFHHISNHSSVFTIRYRLHIFKQLT
ncbi:hypothetical protein PF005_g23678 [Phytophthora fragariae]|uniref:Uncharacterized protein n=1 Tax=Phytophthora fragariae TaxID=53985 RepID=A0A6A3IJI3_9STRA|nr:hypothetical protein PF003_g17295 [Phytophthora fragariae]KAE8923813.1 hypothetical protein PF009_g25942 [Phytophthora fragariae]KAE8980725.1 hypothetical protein PF011_g22322 [Phytophthora fragariae]KAE9078856.1 hypothetical protein PF007_g23683 [Phytophthora fragariae]KAE9100674.1 hypothetical protein PF006_g22851 [Phytophthora fragariae]